MQTQTYRVLRQAYYNTESPGCSLLTNASLYPKVSLEHSALHHFHLILLHFSDPYMSVYVHTSSCQNDIHTNSGFRNHTLTPIALQHRCITDQATTMHIEHSAFDAFDMLEQGIPHQRGVDQVKFDTRIFQLLPDS